MMAIVLKDSTYKRVLTRLRHDASIQVFLSLPSRVFHEFGSTYLYFEEFHDLCCASDFLHAYNAVYRVADFCI